MAYVNPNDPLAPNANQNPLNQQAPISSGGAGMGGAAKPQNTPGVNVPAQPSAQLSSYLAANQPQATEFGQGIANTVGQQVNAAGQSIPQAVNTYTGGIYSVPTDASVNAAVAASPSSLTPEQKAIYQKELGAAGAAPNAADTFEATQGYQDAASKIQGAVSQADLWNSGNNPSHLTTALAPFEGASATAGDRTLDSLLLSRTPEAYKQIQAAVAPAAGFSANLAAGTDSANAALRAAISQDQATTQAARGAADQYVTGLNSTLQGYLAQAKKDADAYNASVNGLSTQVASRQPQVAALQDAIAAFNSMRGSVPGTSFLSPLASGEMGAIPATVSGPSIDQLATPKQYSDISALMELLGGNVENSPLNAGNSSLAGTYQSPGAIPSLENLLNPIYAPTYEGLTNAEYGFASHPNDLTLQANRGALTSAEDAYSALIESITGTKPPPFAPNYTPGSSGDSIEHGETPYYAPTYSYPTPPPSMEPVPTPTYSPTPSPESVLPDWYDPSMGSLIGLPENPPPVAPTQGTAMLPTGYVTNPNGEIYWAGPGPEPGTSLRVL